MASKMNKGTWLVLKAPTGKRNPCRKSKKLVDPCELPRSWKDKNRFKQ